MAKITKSEMNYARERFRRDYGKTASPQAGRLMRELLNTIIEDPDPRWAMHSEAERERIAHKLLAEIPSLLEEVAETENSGREVRAPDVLHWLGMRVPQRLRMLGFVFDKK